MSSSHVTEVPGGIPLSCICLVEVRGELSIEPAGELNEGEGEVEVLMVRRAESPAEVLMGANMVEGPLPIMIDCKDLTFLSLSILPLSLTLAFFWRLLPLHISSGMRVEGTPAPAAQELLMHVGDHCKHSATKVREN